MTHAPVMGCYWFEAVPGSHKTGCLVGHLIPAVFYGTYCILCLTLAIRRYSTNSRSNTRSIMPERDLTILAKMGWLGITVTTVGFLIELNSRILPHEIMYICFFLVGLAKLWESKGRLPLDTNRKVIVLMKVVVNFMYMEHASMKNIMADSLMHYYQSYLGFTSAAFIAYSIYQPSSVTAFVFGYVLWVVECSWMIQTGIYASCTDFSMHLIGTYLALHLATAALAVLVTLAFYIPHRHTHHPHDHSNDDADSITDTEKAEFSPLSMREDDTAEDSDKL